MTSNLKSVIFPKTQTLNAIDSVVLVLDVIEDYENLFSKSSIDSINKLVKNAEKFNIPIIFTKWERIENSKIKDVIDKKRPISYYIKRKSNFIKSIYIPRNVTIIKTKYTNNKVSLTYLHNYTGYRYTSNDNLNYLPSFQLGSLFFSYQFFQKKNNLDVFYKINNLYNNNYQLIINRPIPMINHELGFNLKLNK